MTVKIAYVALQPYKVGRDENGEAIMVEPGDVVVRLTGDPSAHVSVTAGRVFPVLVSALSADDKKKVQDYEAAQAAPVVEQEPTEEEAPADGDEAEEQPKRRTTKS